MSRRGLLGGAVLLLWLVMMGLLVKREVLVPRFDPLSQTVRRLEEPTESWMTLRTADDARVGYVHLQHIPEERENLEGVTSRVAVRLTLNLFGRSTDLDLSGSAWRPYEQQRVSFDFRVRSGEYDFQIDGDVAEGRLQAEILSAGEALPLELPVDQDLFFSSGFGSTLSLPDLDVGDEARISSFDPLTLRSTPTRVRCTAREILEVADGAGETRSIATRVFSLDSGGMKSRAWIDNAGNVVRAETPLGLVLERATASEALAPITGNNAGGFLELTAIEPSGEKVFRGARSMLVEISGVDGEPLPADATQVAVGARRYRITTAPQPTDDAGIGEDLAAYLAADAFVQSDHPKLRRQAEAILATVPEAPWERAEALHRWVFESIEKQAVISIPSALEVLEQLRGDCNEHTVLYTALARSAGLPTRIAIGIVWSDLFDGFYYHAWPEVHVGGRWIWLDPTLGQTVADATHIKITNGGIETWSQLLPYLGRLQVHVLEVE